MARDLTIAETLKAIFNGEVGEEDIETFDKVKLEEFILEIFNKGVLDDYIGIER